MIQDTGFRIPVRSKKQEIRSQKNKSCILHLVSCIFISGIWHLASAVHAQEAANEPSSATGGEQETLSDFPDEFGEFEKEFKKEESTGTPKVFDPLQGYNRFMFTVNDKFYFWLLKPAAKGYNKVMPKFARKSINRAFLNLGFPLRFVSSLFQLKFKKAGTELGRFVVNSTAGIGGFWDPAGKYLKWHPTNEDLGQMLGRWGVGDGFPIVVPILGQTNLRDGIGRIGAIWLNPVVYLADTPTSIGVAAGERLNFGSLHLGEYESIKKDAFDPYTFLRDAYKQLRDQQIKE